MTDNTKINKRVYGHEDNGVWVRPKVNENDSYTYHWNADYANDPSKPILKISKSSLGCFTWCNKQYEYQYLDRRRQEQTPVMLKGTVVHNSHEDFYNSVDIKKAEGMTFEELRVYFTSLFPIDEYVDLTQQMVTYEANRFIEEKESGTLSNFVPVGNEVQLDTDIIILPNTNPRYPLTQAYVVHLQGIIDRIFREGDSLIPMELKTGKWKDSKISSMRAEMAFYALLLENVGQDEYEKHNLPYLPITHWGWYYPAANHITVEERKKASTTSVKKAIAKLLYNYEHNMPDNFSPSFFHKKCLPHCSFNTICPAAVRDELNGDWF